MLHQPSSFPYGIISIYPVMLYRWIPQYLDYSCLWFGMSNTGHATIVLLRDNANATRCYRASLTPKTATFKVSGVQAELPQNTQRYGKKRQAVVVTIVESAQLGSILVHTTHSVLR